MSPTASTWSALAILAATAAVVSLCAEDASSRNYATTATSRLVTPNVQNVQQQMRMGVFDKAAAIQEPESMNQLQTAHVTASSFGPAAVVGAVGGLIVVALLQWIQKKSRKGYLLQPLSVASITAVPSAGLNFQDPGFQATTIAAFPAKKVATPEEARVLWKLDGYSILDIRSDLEGSDRGRIRGPNKGSVDIPMFQAKSTYDSTLGKRVVTQQVNPQWLEQVKAKFQKDSKVIVMCSDGDKRSRQALNALAAEGFRNLVLLGGGFNAWDQIFDKKLLVRNAAARATRSEWQVDPVNWGQWAAAVGMAAPPPQVYNTPTTPSAPAYIAPPTASVPPATVIGAQLLFQEPSFQAATIASFPAKGAATPDEARVLWKLDGYSMLDLRSDMEGADRGRIRGPNKGSIDIPMFQAKSTYDVNLGKRVVTQQANGQWLEQVKARFPKDAKIILVCSDGDKRSQQAQALLSREGYRNLVVLSGGFNTWDMYFDKRLGVRSTSARMGKSAAIADLVEWGRWPSGAPATVSTPYSSPTVAAPPSPAPTSQPPPPAPTPTPASSSWQSTPPPLPRAATPPPPPPRASTPPPPPRSASPPPASGTPLPPVKAVSPLMFDDPVFQAATIAAFPAKGIATPPEARVLWRLADWNILDIRSDAEGNATGRIRRLHKGTVDIPMFQGKYAFDQDTQRKVLRAAPNPQWLAQVRARVPLDSKVIVMCSDGRQRSVEALEILEEEGYTNLVGMMGGYNKWDQYYDRKMMVRTPASQRERAAKLKDETEWPSWKAAVEAMRTARAPVHK